MLQQLTAGVPGRRFHVHASRTSPAEAKMTLAFRCVDVKRRAHLEAMEAMMEQAREITFRTFARHVDWKPIGRDMGYRTRSGEDGLILAKDWAVQFFSSRYEGERVYFMRHSAIEYVFKSQPQDQALRPQNPWG